MGIRFESSNIILPTTRLLLFIRKRSGFDPERVGQATGNPGRETRRKGVIRVYYRLRSILLLLMLFAEEWYRQALAWFYQKRGYIVLFERHFIADFHAFQTLEAGKRPDFGTRLHGAILKHWYPHPDLAILLDGPPEVFFKRKGEGSVERLARLRQGYLEFGQKTRRFVAVDAASQTEVQVSKEIHTIIKNFLSSHDRNLKPG